MSFISKIASNPSRINHSPAVQPQEENDATQTFKDNSPKSNLQLMHATIQAELNIGKPDDKYEKEADATAENVMSKPGTLQKKSEAPDEIQQMSEEESEVNTKSLLQPVLFDDGKDVRNDMLNAKEEDTEISAKEDEIQSKVSREQPGADFENKLNNSKGGGNKLPHDTRKEMEQRFGGRDFSNVRVHNDSTSAEMNKGIHSKAFTNKNHIFFNSGQLNNTESGKKLLAHELTHTVQQGASGEEVQAKEETKAEEKKTVEGKEEKKESAAAGPEKEKKAIDPVAENFTLLNDYTSQIISKKDDGQIQRKVEDFEHSEDQEGPESKVEERMEEDGIDTTEQPDEDDERPDKDEMEEQKADLNEDAKPEVDREEESAPKLIKQGEELKKEAEEGGEVTGTETKNEDPKKEKEPQTPAEMAKANAEAAFERSKSFMPPPEPKPVAEPELKIPVDKGGEEIEEANPMHALRVAAIATQIQVYRKKAYDLKTGAIAERAKAEEMRGMIETGYFGIYQSDEAIDLSFKHTEARKESVADLETHRDESDRRIQWVLTETPALKDKASEGAEETTSMASELDEQEKEGSDVPEDPETSENNKETEEGLKNSSQESHGTDEAMKTMNEDVLVNLEKDATDAKQKNAVTSEKLTVSHEHIATSEAKLSADKELNAKAKANFDALSKKPDDHAKKAERQEKKADANLKKSLKQEKKLNDTQTWYYAQMSKVPKRESEKSKGNSGFAPGENSIQRSVLDEESAQILLNDQQMREAFLASIENDYERKLVSNELDMRTNFSTMTKDEKSWYALSVAYNKILGAISENGFSGFMKDAALVAFWPPATAQFMAHLMWPDTKNDPWWVATFRYAAGWTSAAAVLFGSLLAFSTVGFLIGTALSWWLVTTPAGLAMMAYCGPLMKIFGALFEMASYISTIFHLLALAYDLEQAENAETSAGLADSSDQVADDIERGMVAYVGTAGAFVGPFLGKIFGKTKIGTWFERFKVWSDNRIAANVEKLNLRSNLRNQGKFNFRYRNKEEALLDENISKNEQPLEEIKVAEESEYVFDSEESLVNYDPAKNPKPKHSPDLKKWIGKGGKVEILKDGRWKYTDWEGNSVIYEGDFPIFDPYVRQEVDIDMKGNSSDFAKADAQAPLGPKLPENTWHHHQNGTTMQEVPFEINSRFTHKGGASIKRNK